MAKTKIAVLVSGGGTNLQALIDAQGTVLNSGEITLVVSNARGAYALERAKKAGIDTAVVLKKECGSHEAFETRLMEVLDENGIDIIILAGFMTILTENFTSAYPRRILNVHPSLIPSFCGEGFYGLRVSTSFSFSSKAAWEPHCFFSTVSVAMPAFFARSRA